MQQYLADIKSGKFQDFNALMDIISKHYQHRPTAFDNGELHNASHENQGSAKLLFFAQLHQLDHKQTLACFGQYYQEVLDNPNQKSHGNIRNFIKFGWDGVVFSDTVLTPL